MEDNNKIKKGLSIEWETETVRCGYYYNSPKFDIFGGMWRFISTNRYERSQYTNLEIRLVNCESKSSYNASFSVVMFLSLYRETRQSSERISLPYKSSYVIFKEIISSEIKSITIRCGFYQRLDFNLCKDVSTQVSVKCFESQIKRKCLEGNSSIKISESSLTSPVHLEILSEDFSNMLQKAILTDITLKNGEVSILAHKAVLASRSKVFSSMFQHEMVEKTTGSIDIDDIEVPVLQEFLKYLYSGRISEGLSAEIILELYKASDKYAVQSLQEGCRDIFVRNLTEENCIEVLTLGENHSDQQLKDAVAQFITGRYDILMSDAWLEFTGNFPKLANVIYKLYVEKTSIIKQDSCK